MKLRIIELGLIPYTDALIRQRLEAKVVEQGAADALLLMEHPAVITMGVATKDEHLLCTPEQYLGHGIEVQDTDRGGDVTYHGPGQLVAWPIMNFRTLERDVPGLVRRYEQVLIDVLKSYNLEGVRIPGYTGVWLGDEKLAAIGVAIKRMITRHGIAVNLNPDLNHFKTIIPCGIRDKGVTSLAARGIDVNVGEFSHRLIHQFAKEFNYTYLEESTWNSALPG